MTESISDIRNQFKLDITPEQEIFIEKILAHGFDPKVTGDNGTLSFVKDGTKYGYINDWVNKNEFKGVIGLTFHKDKHPNDSSVKFGGKVKNASPYASEIETIKWLEDTFSCTAKDYVIMPFSPHHYIHIKSLDLAERAFGISE